MLKLNGKSGLLREVRKCKPCKLLSVQPPQCYYADCYVLSIHFIIRHHTPCLTDTQKAATITPTRVKELEVLTGGEEPDQDNIADRHSTA